MGGGILEALGLIALAFALGAGGYSFIATMLDATRDAFSKPFGDVAELPVEAQFGSWPKKPGGGAGVRPAADTKGEIAPHGTGL